MEALCKKYAKNFAFVSYLTWQKQSPNIDHITPFAWKLHP